MRILQVVPSYYPATVYGGPIFSIHATCQALARQDVEIAVATTNANGDTKLDVDCRNIVKLEPNYYVRYYDDTIINRFSWAFTFNLWRDVRRSDVVHLQDVFSAHAALTFILAALFRKPLLVSVRGVFAPWGLSGKRPWLKKLWLSFLVRPFIRDDRRVAWHATAESERDEVLSVLPDAKIFVIPNGVDCDAFDHVNVRPTADYLGRFFPGCGADRKNLKVFVGLGRLHPKKAFDVSIKAFGSIAEANPGAVFLIAGGDDGEREPLSRLINELGLERRVALIGEVKGADKLEFLKGADLFLFPSHNENFGMVLLEALAAGVPVVASRNTPWAEIEAAEAGRWVANTPAAFAQAIEELLSKNLPDMRRSARSYAARYDLTVVAAAFKKLYTDMIDVWHRKQ